MEFTKIEDWKAGWWKKGKTFRYCYGIQWFEATPLVVHQTKSQYLKNSNKKTATPPYSDDWFPNAEYIGIELEEAE